MSAELASFTPEEPAGGLADRRKGCGAVLALGVIVWALVILAGWKLLEIVGVL